MKTFYVEENNSGGDTKYLACGIDKADNKKKYHVVKIKAKDIDDMIDQFEKVFGCNWDYENSYEGNSCNCCGRRFEVEMISDENIWEEGIRGFSTSKKPPYKWTNKKIGFGEIDSKRAEIKNGKLVEVN